MDTGITVDELILKEFSDNKLKMTTDFEEDLWKYLRRSLSDNIIQQFGIEKLVSEAGFKDGGPVDTIHNVRRGIYATDEERVKFENNTKYNKNIQRELHGGSKAYRDINREYSEQKKSGHGIDAYTGKNVSINEDMDLDHVIPTKEIHEDAGRILSETDSDKLANNQANLKLTNKNLNRSKQDKNMTEFIAVHKKNERNLKQERAKIAADLSIDDDVKRKKLSNIDNKLAANYEKMEKADKHARLHNNLKISKDYYTSPKFIKATAKSSMQQGLANAKRQAIGVMLYSIKDMLFEELIPFVKDWSLYHSMEERLTVFKQKIQHIKEKAVAMWSKLKDSLIDGFEGGVVSNLVSVAMNAFMTVLGDISKVLRSVITGGIQAFKFYRANRKTMTKRELMQNAMKLIVTPLTAMVGVVFSEALNAHLLETPLAPWANLISSSVSALLTGIFAGLLLYAIDNFPTAISFAEAKEDIIFGLQNSAANIKEKYEAALAKIDDMYVGLLDKIIKRYEETDQLGRLAHDLQAVADIQLENSVKYAVHSGVDQTKVLHNQTEIMDYFNK